MPYPDSTFPSALRCKQQEGSSAEPDARPGMMKSYDVFMDTFVNVMLPAGCDPETHDGMEMLWSLAIAEFQERLRRIDEVTFTWERFPDGDMPSPV